MTTLELKKRLIDKIRKTKNDKLLEEAYRLFELETKDIEVYNLNNGQIQAINEARDQIKAGKYLTSDQADNEIEEWLSK